MKTNKFPDRAAQHQALALNFRSWISLAVGLVVGFCMAKLFITTTQSRLDWMLHAGNHHNLHETHYKSQSQNLSDVRSPKSVVSAHIHASENSSIADKLYNDVRVLCWIMTNPKHHKSKALHIKRTWGQRCNKLIFISTEDDEELNAIGLNVTEGKKYVWSKTKEAFKYVYENHFNDADWFFKADDDTYTIVENLRFLLYPYDPRTPIYFGCRFKPFVKQGYMSGGAGYVLSKEAVRRLVTLAIPQPKLCDQNDWGVEDVELGKCLENVNVTAGDSRDPKGFNTFFGVDPAYLLLPRDRKFWYWRYIYYKVGEGFDCCSDNAITFHYIAPKQMYVMDYMIYHLRPYGIVKTLEELPQKLKAGEMFTFQTVTAETNSTE